MTTWYEIYRQSDHWRATRKRAITHANGRCQRCLWFYGRHPIRSRCQLEVHHKHYRTLHRESLADLLVLCSYCHGEEHGIPRPPETPDNVHHVGTLTERVLAAMTRKVRA